MSGKIMHSQSSTVLVKLPYALVAKIEERDDRSVLKLTVYGGADELRRVVGGLVAALEAIE